MTLPDLDTIIKHFSKSMNQPMQLYPFPTRASAVAAQLQNFELPIPIIFHLAVWLKCAVITAAYYFFARKCLFPCRIKGEKNRLNLAKKVGSKLASRFFFAANGTYLSKVIFRAILRLIKASNGRAAAEWNSAFMGAWGIPSTSSAGSRMAIQGHCLPLSLQKWKEPERKPSNFTHWLNSLQFS